MKGKTVIIIFIAAASGVAIAFLDVFLSGAGSFGELSLKAKISSIVSTALLLFLFVCHFGKMISDWFK